MDLIIAFSDAVVIVSLKSLRPVDLRPLSDTFVDILSSERRLRFFMLPLAFGGGNKSGTSLSGRPGPGYEMPDKGSARPIRRDGNGIDGGLSPNPVLALEEYCSWA